MKRTRMVIIAIFIISAVCMMTACQAESTDRNSTNNNTKGSIEESFTTVTPVTTEAPTVPELPSETDYEITKSELMELIWWEDELADVGKVIYPGFELDCEIKDGEYYRIFRSKEKEGIEIWEKVYEPERGFPISRGQIILRNSEISKECSIDLCIGNRYDKNTFSREEKKLFFMDLTNDGQEELVINIPYKDMGIHENYLYVFDSESFEQIALPDRERLRNRIESELEAVEMKTSKDEGMLDVDITIGGKTYEAHTDLFEQWKAEDMRYGVVGDYGYGGFGAGDSGAYYRAGIYIYHKDYDYSVNNRNIAIDIPLAYNPELNAFEAVEGEYIVNNLR